MAACSITDDISCSSWFSYISNPGTQRGFRCSGENREVLDVSGVGCCWEVVENIGTTCKNFLLFDSNHYAGLIFFWQM